MTLSNNAIKFLQAQYRAIFKRAYVKGLATAVLLTAGLAAGQAQAAWPTQVPTGATPITFVTDQLNQGSNSLAEGTVLSGTASGDTNSNKTYSVANSVGGADSTLTNSADIYLTLSSGNTQVINAINGDVVNEGNIYLQSSGANGNWWQAYALFNVGTDGNANSNTLTNTGTIDVTDAIAMAFSSTGAGSLVNEGTLNVTASESKGAVGLDMASSSLNSADNSLINHGTINTSGSGAYGIRVTDGTSLGSVYNDGSITGTGVSIAVIDATSANTSGISVTLADNSKIESMQISDGNSIVFRNNTDELVFETVESSGTNTDSTLTLENSKITFNKGTSGSVFSEINLDADSQLTNNTEMTFTGSELTLSAEQFKRLFSSETGKLTISGTGTTTVTIDGEQNWDLTSNSGGLGTLKADGTLSPSGDFLISGEKKVTFKADEITLGSAFKTDKLSLDAGTLNVTAGSNKRFILSSGEITVHEALNGAAATDRVVIKAETEGQKATLNLIADEQGKVTNIDRFNVGWISKASGTSTLKVDGTWDFGGARVTASNNGKVNFDGTVSNVSDLMLEKNGAVTVNGNLTIERLLAGEDNNSGSSLELNGKLTVVGDNREGGDKGVKNYYNDVQLTETTVNINNGGTLAITTKDALDDFLTFTTNDSGVFTSITVSASGDKTTDIGGWSGNKVNLKAGGTLHLELSTLGGTTLSQAQLSSLKESLVASDSKGSFDFGEGLTIDLEDSLQKDIENGEVSYTQLSDAEINDVKGIADGVTVTVTDAEATTGIHLSNGAAAVKLASGTPSVAVDGSLILNGSGGNFVYYEDAVGTQTVADVSVKSGSGVNLTGAGTVGSLTKVASATGTSAVLTAGQNATQTVQGTIDLDKVTIGAGTVDVTESVTADELTVNGTLTVSGGAGTVTIGTTGATIAGTLNAGDITSSGDMSVTGSVLANSIVLDTNKNLTVGDDSNSGLVEVESLDLNGGMLLIDPDWNQDASFVVITGGVKDPDVIDVGGSIGVGQNSVGVFGAGEQEAQDALSRLGLLQAGKLDAQDIGAALYLDDTLQIANQKHVLVDKTMDNTDLSTAINNTITAGLSSGSVTLAAGSALVISESFSNELVDAPNKAIFEFAAATGTVSVSAESGAKIIFDSADILGGDIVTVATSTATITTTLDNAEITAAGGLLIGDPDDNTDRITFSLNPNASTRLYNQSNPIRDMTLDVVGNKNGTYDSADYGVYYIGAMNAHNGGADIERTARMALYGGAVQATLMAQQTSTDAISERLGMANPNSALITSNNAQGGGLWLSPVYKNHDSDEFEAEGVNYGADIDLYGLALGADFTTESGVRVGAMFNVGSGDAEGQGIGEGVSNDFDYYGFSLYAGVTFGNFALTADAGFTQVSNDLEQAVNYHGVGTLKADTDTQTVSVGVRGEYLFATPWVDVVPHVGVRYTSFDMDSYQAQVDGYTIANADADSMQVFSIPFGVTFSKDMAMGNWVVKPVFDLNLTANAGDDELESDVAFVGVSNVALTTEVMDSFTYGATLGVSAQYQESFSFGLNVGYTGSSSADEFGVNANARYTF